MTRNQAPPLPQALPQRCHLLRRFHVEAPLSKFSKCLFILVRWGLGEAVNVKMAPAPGPERRFLGLPSSTAVMADPGRPVASQRGPQSPGLSPSILPLRPPARLRGPYLLFLLPGTHSEVNLSRIHQDDNNELSQRVARGLVRAAETRRWSGPLYGWERHCWNFFHRLIFSQRFPFLSSPEPWAPV